MNQKKIPAYFWGEVRPYKMTGWQQIYTTVSTTEDLCKMLVATSQPGPVRWNALHQRNFLTLSPMQCISAKFCCKNPRPPKANRSLNGQLRSKASSFANIATWDVITCDMMKPFHACVFWSCIAMQSLHLHHIPKTRGHLV